MEVTDSSIKTKGKKFPVVEIFGPTIQGEGPEQGRPVHFIRMGGCDYRCTWCDSPFAVLPELVRSAARNNVETIVSRILHLARGPDTIVISGGNPLLHDLEPLIFSLHALGYRTAVETQGTLFKHWLYSVDSVVVSPKPPSSNMKRQDINELRHFMSKVPSERTCLKIVVFDNADLEWAKAIHYFFPDIKMYLSAGNDAGATVGNPQRKDERNEVQVAFDLMNKGRWLANRVMVDPEFSNVQVQMQQHVLYWGNERGR